MLKRLLKSKKGAALVEYGLLIAGVALVSAAARVPVATLLSR